MNKLRDLLDPEKAQHRALVILSADGRRHGIDEEVLYVCNGLACGGWCTNGKDCKHTPVLQYAKYKIHNDFDRDTIYDDELQYGFSRLIERIH